MKTPSRKESQEFAILSLTDALDFATGVREPGEGKEATRAFMDMFDREVLVQPGVVEMFSLVVHVATAAALVMSDHEDDSRARLQYLAQQIAMDDSDA